MSILDGRNRNRLATALIAAGFGVFGIANAADSMMKVTLSGANEVPPVKSAGSATGDVTVGDDGSVKGSVKVTGFTPTAAHIHMAAPGANGGVIVPMQKKGDDMFEFPAGAKMTPEQLTAFKAGNTYLNVHSAANPGGEVRGQLKP
jgi:hypothetical protein